MLATGCKAYNAFLPRERVDVPHSFSIKLRSDLTSQELEWLRRDPTDADFPRRPLDVFCVVKLYMHCRRPNGPPVLMLPCERFAQLITPAPNGTSQKTMKDPRKDALREFALELEHFTMYWSIEHSYADAVKELRALADDPLGERAPQGWLERAGNAPQHSIPQSDNPFYTFLPNMSWRLLVDFKK